MEANKVPDSPNGTYTLPPSYKVESGDTSDISQHNPPFEDLAQAVSDRLHRDGRTSWTGNQNANGFKVTGLAQGTNPGDALSVGAVGPAIGSAAEKAAIVDGDHVAIADSQDSQKLKRVKWGTLKAVIQSFLVDPWTFQPIGVPVPVFDNITGVSAPPTNKSYRYIKLTASDGYNSGVLTGQSVTGSAPLVVATAVINLSGSPINGQTVNLINTERRFLRAGAAGTVENDAIQDHTHPVLSSEGAPQRTGQSRGLYGGPSASTDGDVVADNRYTDKNTFTEGKSLVGLTSLLGTRTGNETRPKNIGVTYFMRVL